MEVYRDRERNLHHLSKGIHAVKEKKSSNVDVFISHKENLSEKKKLKEKEAYENDATSTTKYIHMIFINKVCKRMHLQYKIYKPSQSGHLQRNL